MYCHCLFLFLAFSAIFFFGFENCTARGKTIGNPGSLANKESVIKSADLLNWRDYALHDRLLTDGNGKSKHVPYCVAKQL
jgi:hypothetical protein